MKSTLTFLCVLALSSNLFCQLLNGEFDNWTTIDTMGQPYEDLVGWNTNNETVQLFRATTPNVRFQEGADVGVFMSTSYQGLDGLSSGIISQYLDTEKLIDITYLSKCDSIADRGACVVNIFDEQDQLIYTDSVTVVESSFTVKTIEASQLQLDDNQKIKLEFQAFGQIGAFEVFQAYSEFLLLNASANYISATDKLADRHSLNVFPNPCRDKIYLRNPDTKDVGVYELLDANGKVVLSGQGAEIATSSLDSGFYFLVVKTEKGSQTRPIVKI